MAITIQAKTKYLDEPAVVRRRTYPTDGSDALQLLSQDGHPLATATVCLAAYGMKPEPGHVFIKDYSENEGMYDCLLREGVIDPGERISIGPYDATCWHAPLATGTTQLVDAA